MLSQDPGREVLDSNLSFMFRPEQKTTGALSVLPLVSPRHHHDSTRCPAALSTHEYETFVRLSASRTHQPSVGDEAAYSTQAGYENIGAAVSSSREHNAGANQMETVPARTRCQLRPPHNCLTKCSLVAQRRSPEKQNTELNLFWL